MTFFRLWFLGIVRPVRFAEQLGAKPTPRWGFAAVLVRFVGTSLTTGLLNLIFHAMPFEPSSLTFLPTEGYYRVQPFFLPLFGLAVWLLMSGAAHTALRLAGKPSDFDQVLNIVGVGMLVPMPVVWLWDWTMIVTDAFQVMTMAISHSVFQLWETAVEAICFRRVLGLGVVPSILLALCTNVLFVLLAMTFVR